MTVRVASSRARNPGRTALRRGLGVVLVALTMCLLTACGGAPAPVAAGMQDFMKQLQSVRVVSCTEAAWRLLGLSLAGWNALASLALLGLALLGLRRATRQG